MRNDSNFSVGVIGLGLIGASILKDLQKHAPNTIRYGYSSGKEQQIAEHDKLIQSGFDLKHIVNHADLIIIATPIGSVETVSQNISELHDGKNNLVVIDVASVKQAIFYKFEKLNKQYRKITFITTHPMGGSERNGYEAAKRGLFRGKPWIICPPTKIVKPKTYNLLQSIIRDACGAIIYTIDSPEQHDQRIAATSHFILNMSNMIFDFINSRHPESLKTAGESFITTTRLASDNPIMLSEINQNNKESIKKITNEFIEFLRMHENSLLDIDYFRRNKHARDSWLHHRNKDITNIDPKNKHMIFRKPE